MNTRAVLSRPSRAALAATLVASLLSARAEARTITVTPNDDYKLIESAQPGDVVEIQPGIYKFRVSLETAGTAQDPITVRAADPKNRPVWDLGGMNVSAWPGSYNAGDKGRGCWQVRGGHYRIEGIVFRNCVDHGSAGLRIVNVPDVTISNCLFQGSTNGLTGAGDGIVVEYSEFDTNGKALPGDAAAHQIYIFGGTLAVRYSYLHDAPLGQDFHVRSRDATLEYNWITRPGSYLGDLMTCEYFCGGAAGQAITQKMLLRGNVLVQGMSANLSQAIALYKDETGSTDGTGDVGTMELTLIANTVIGTPLAQGKTHRFVNLRNDSVAAKLHATDNVVTDFFDFALPEAPQTMNYQIDGANNWLTTATTATGLTGTLFGKDPLLAADHRPMNGSPLIGAAAATPDAPTFEYYRDEMVTLGGRARASALDIGAFEATTASPPFGPGYGAMPDGGAPAMDAGSEGVDGGNPGDMSTGTMAVDLAMNGGGSDAGAGAAQAGGCSCEVARSSQDRSVSWWMAAALLGALLTRRARGRGHDGAR